MRVSELMTRDVVTIGQSDSRHEAVARMDRGGRPRRPGGQRRVAHLRDRTDGSVLAAPAAAPWRCGWSASRLGVGSARGYPSLEPRGR